MFWIRTLIESKKPTVMQSQYQYFQRHESWSVITCEQLWCTFMYDQNHVYAWIIISSVYIWTTIFVIFTPIHGNKILRKGSRNYCTTFGAKFQFGHLQKFNPTKITCCTENNCIDYHYIHESKNILMGSWCWSNMLFKHIVNKLQWNSFKPDTIGESEILSFIERCP